MIARTEQEIQDFVRKLLIGPQWEYYGNLEINVRVSPEDVEIDVADMYEYVPLEFRHLSALAEFFDTKNIADAARSSYNGCETCDYGSKYTWRLNIRPDKTS